MRTIRFAMLSTAGAAGAPTNKLRRLSMRADEQIDMPDLALHAELGGTALSRSPGINAIHRVAVSGPVRLMAERKGGAHHPFACWQRLDSLRILKGLRHSRREGARALSSRRPGFRSPLWVDSAKSTGAAQSRASDHGIKPSRVGDDPSTAGLSRSGRPDARSSPHRRMAQRSARRPAAPARSSGAAGSRPGGRMR
jgi:hypothetical protein